jgi:carboxypeptidase C (cathepsin A)
LKNFTSWFFSGTQDMAVDTLGSLRWIDKLNLDIKNEWRQWICDGQVAGMIQDYDFGFSFVTVKGAGHMVPQDKRKQAKVMLDNFLNRSS